MLRLEGGLTQGARQSLPLPFPMFQPGHHIREYEIEICLGEGGMGQVWRARHVFLEERRALKVLDPHAGANPYRKRFSPGNSCFSSA